MRRFLIFFRALCFQKAKRKLVQLKPSRFTGLAAVLAFALSGCLPQETSIPVNTSQGPASNSFVDFNGATTVDTTGYNKLKVSWSPSTDSRVVAYNIYDTTLKFKPELIKTIPAPASEALITNLNPQQLYYFRVRAADSEGKEDGNTLDVAGIPFGGIASSEILNGNTALLKYGDASDADHVNIYCKTSPTAEFELIHELYDTAATSYKLENLVAGTRYICKVALVVGGVIDNNTETVSFTPMGEASKLEFITQPTSSLAGVPFSAQPVVRILDADGNVITAGVDSTAPITISIATDSPTQGTISGAATISAIAGVATFTGVNIREAGTKILTATKPDTSSQLNGSAELTISSEPFTISPGPVSPNLSSIKITPEVPPSPALTANGFSAYSVQITLLDEFANPVSGVKPTFASSISGDIISQPTQNSSVTGVASGAIATTVADSLPPYRTLSISSPSGLTGVTTLAPFVPGVASKLGFSQQPVNSPSGANGMGPVAVAVQDAQGNVVMTGPSSTADITLSIASNVNGAALLGTVTVAAVNGVANFTDLGIDKTQTGYKLVASATSLTTTYSNSFNVTAGTPKKIKITGPVSFISGTCSSAVTIQLQDDGGNPTNTLQNTPVLISGLSSAGLYTSSSCSGTPVSSTVTFTAGTNTKTYYMKDLKSESSTMMATDSSGVMTAGSYVFKVSPSKIALLAEAPPPMAMGTPLSVVSGQCSAPIVIRPAGENGAAGPLFAITPVIIGGIIGSSATLYSDAACTIPVVATDVQLPITLGAGYDVYVYLKDNKSESLNLSVTDPSANMVTTSALQPVFITPSAIEFSGPSSVVAGRCSTAFTVALKDAAGNQVAPSVNTSLNVSGLTSSASAMFYSSPVCGGAGSQTTVVIPQNATSTVVYLKDNLAETLNIFLEDPAGMMTNSATLAVGVSPSAFTIVGPIPGTAANTVCAGPFDLKTVDGVGTVTAAITPINGTLSGAGSAGAFYSDSECSVPVTNFTFAQGQSVFPFYFKGQYPAPSLTFAATDDASILDPGSFAFAVTAAPGWIGTKGTNLDANGNQIWFTMGGSPVAARSNGTASVYDMTFDPTRQYLYVADYNADRVLKYDYTNQTYVGWVGGYTSSGAIGVSGSNLANPSPALCVATTNAQVVPGWCVGGSSYASSNAANGVMYNPIAIAVDSTYMYVANYNSHSVQRFRADTGAFSGWIGRVSAPPTGSGPGGPPSCTSTVANDPTPGWCLGGSSKSGNDDGDGSFRYPRSMAVESGNLYVGVYGAILRYDAASGAFTGWIGMVNTVSPTAGAAGCNTTGANSLTPGWCLGGNYKYVNPRTHNGGGGVGYPRSMIVIGNTLYVSFTESGGGINTYDLTSGAYTGLLPNLSFNWTSPIGMKYDGTNLIVADWNRVIKVDPATGLVLSWIGKVSNNASMSGNPGCSTLNPNDDTPGWCLGGSAKHGLSEASFNQATAIAYDGAGNFLVGMGGSHPAIKKFDVATGTYAGTLAFQSSSPTSWSNDSNAFAQFYGFDDNSMWSPAGSYVDGNYIYLTEASSGRIKKINKLTGVLEGSIGGITSLPTGGDPACLTATPMGPAPGWCLGALFNPNYLWNYMINQTTPGIFYRAQDITGDGTYLYIADMYLHRIQRFNKVTGQSGGWIGGIGTTPTGGAAGCTGATVSTFTPGWCTGGYSQSGSGDGFLSSPNAITYVNGNLYVVDSSNHRVSSYNATTGAFNGWVGRIGSAPSGGCTYGSNGLYDVSTGGWCTGGTATAANNGGDRGGGFYFWAGGRGGIYSDGSFLYVSNYYNGRIDKYSFAGVWLGAARGSWNSYVHTWTTDGPTLSGWSGYANTGIWGDGTYLYGNSNSTVVWKMNLATGTIVGWRGAINPGSSPTGGDPGCPGATIVTPGWCQGGSYTNGYRMGQFSANYAVSGDANFIYVSDEGNHRLNRIPK